MVLSVSGIKSPGSSIKSYTNLRSSIISLTINVPLNPNSNSPSGLELLLTLLMIILLLSLRLCALSDVIIRPSHLYCQVHSEINLLFLDFEDESKGSV